MRLSGESFCRHDCRIHVVQAEPPESSATGGRSGFWPMSRPECKSIEALARWSMSALTHRARLVRAQSRTRAAVGRRQATLRHGRIAVPSNPDTLPAPIARYRIATAANER